MARLARHLPRMPLDSNDLEQIRGIVAAAKAETVEAMRDMQTEVLRGLERFSRGNFAHLHRLETSDTDI